MKNQLKEKLRAELQQTKRLQIELGKVPTDSKEAIELRKELGIATLKDILGDNYPIRVCRHCGKRAFSENDLWEFSYKADAKYDRDNCCSNCHSLKARYPSIKIVGEYCMLQPQKACVKCGRRDSSRGLRSWFLPRATVCKECLGTHTDAFGFPLAIQDPDITYLWEDQEYPSVQSLSIALRLSYYVTRTLVLQDKLKDYDITTIIKLKE